MDDISFIEGFGEPAQNIFEKAYNWIYPPLEKHALLILLIIVISISALFFFGIEIAMIYAWGIPVALLLHNNKNHWWKAGLQSWFYVVKAVKKF